MPDSRVNILIVDDLPEKLLALEVALESLGQNTVTAQSGREALRRLTEMDFAVILLDVNMPEMDGFETAVLIRKRKKFAHVPIIYITAYADEMHTAQGYSLGAVDYILSPVVPEILRAKVSVFVELYKKTAEISRLAEERIALEREQAARAAAEAASRRFAILAEASSILARSLEFPDSRLELVELLRPSLGDLAAVTLLDEAGRPASTVMAWREPQLPLSGVCTSAAEQLPQSWMKAIENVLSSRQMAAWSEAWSIDAAVDDSPEARRTLTLHSTLVIPLQARRRCLGVLTLALADPERRYDAIDRALVEDLAGRAAVAFDNARLYHDLQESDRRKNEFLSMLAHELRNPLAPLSNAAALLKMEIESAPQIEWATQVIERQVGNLVRIVDDLLDVARITRGKVRLQFQRVNLSDVVERAVETSRPLIEARRHALAVNLPPEPLWVDGDTIRLVQAVTNLLNNAAKFTEEGGSIDMTLQGQAGAAVLKIRDTGIGIPSELIGLIFEPFTQGDQSLDRSQGGLGIGLTLVQRLVEMHGGTVAARSAGRRQGSEFTVCLPLLKEDTLSAGADQVPGINHSRPRSYRMLVVDDNADAAESLAALLRADGHEVRTAHEGATALAIAWAFQPRVVILDIGLPGMDGYAVAAKLREQAGNYQMHLIAATGYGSAEDGQRSLEAGFDQHFVKPVDPQTLNNYLRTLEPGWNHARASHTQESSRRQSDSA